MVNIAYKNSKLLVIKNCFSSKYRKYMLNITFPKACYKILLNKKFKYTKKIR